MALAVHPNLSPHEFIKVLHHMLFNLAFALELYIYVVCIGAGKCDWICEKGSSTHIQFTDFDIHNFRLKTAIAMKFGQ